MASIRAAFVSSWKSCIPEICRDMFTFKNPLTPSFSWLSPLKCWLRPIHAFESQRDISHESDLPSPTLNPSFDTDPESLEIGSSAAMSPCHTPPEDYHCTDNKPLRHTTGRSISKAKSKVLSANSTTTASARTYALLDEYSLQELVLLEFVTHTSDVQPADIDGLLLRYPPGFSRVCRCAGMEEDLCELCRLLDAYMDYSLERFQGTSSAASPVEEISPSI
ncbi:hypothetical protein JB92DRAFT_3141343 [Gautieria morchelliformis]|nr:hypothetical protein JB92DRAFT_3141343 [Gautieria morchelliformis]